MRRAVALAALISLVAAGTAAAEHWTKYADGDGGTQWSYDGDYTYKDKDSGRLIAMKAISKPSANFEPGGPDKGVGYVVAIDCRAKTSQQVAAYKPSTGLVTDANWRKQPAKPADAPLAAALCPHLEHVPVK